MIDANNCFTYAYSAGTYADFFQAITTDSASENYIDLDVAGIKISGGAKPLWICGRVGTVFATLTSLEILLQTDSDSGFGTTLKEVKMWHFLTATLAAGALVINEPLGHFDYQRYMRLYFNSVGSTGTGSIAVWLAAGPEPAVTDIDQVNL
jgi:hypothetical protein